MALPAAPWEPTYETEDDWILHSYPLLTGNVIRFAARDVKRERTGIHATLSISLNWIQLAWSYVNVAKDEERVRLANSAYAHLDTKSNALDMVELPKTVFKHALDLFCFGLWEEVIGQIEGSLMYGNANAPTAKLLVGDFVVQEGGTILFAPPGLGKSYTGLLWGVSCAQGCEKLWKIHDAWTPLFINVERSGSSMAARLARVNTALGQIPETPMPFLNARGKSLSDIYEAAKRTIAKEKCRWIIYDSISRAGNGSLKEDDVANKTMDMLNALCPTWVALAHSPRGDDTHAFGSQMFDAAADVTVQLRSQTSADGFSTGIGLQVIKANDLPKRSMQTHVMEWDDTGLRFVRHGRQGEFADLAAQEKRDKETEARLFLLRVGEATSGQVATHFGWAQNHTGTMLTGARWCQARKQGREILYSVRAEVSQT